MNSTLFLKVLLAMGLAVVAGLTLGPEAKLMQVFHLVGQLFLNALRLVVLPLVVSSLVLGSARMGKEKSFGALGKRVIGTFVFVSTVAVCIGYVLALTLAPGKGVSIPLAAQTAVRSTSLEGFFLGLIPSNLLAAAAKGEMPGVILFSLLFGFFTTKIKPESAALIEGFFQAVFDIVIKITHLVMRCMPIGVFGMVSQVVATTGMEGVRSAFFFLFTVCLGLTLFSVGALSLLLLLRGISPIAHFRRVAPALLTAFSTCSSTVAMPIALDCMKGRSRVSQFALPLGATLSMSGTALNACVTAFFVAQVFGISLSGTDHVLILVMSVIASMGTGGIPSSCLIAAMLVLQTVGLPVEAIGMVIAVERFADMLRSTVNIYGNTCCSALVEGAERVEQVA